MPTYRLDVLAPPNERLLHRREYQAADDAEAIRHANKRYRYFFAGGAALDRYVLYDEHGRPVHEHVGPPSS